MSGEIDPLSIVKGLFPQEDESYYIGLVILCIITPIIVSMFYAINDAYQLVKDNPAYDAANFRFFLQNAYYLMFGAMISTVINLLYALRKRPEKADSKNIGFWFTMSTICLFCLIGARISLSVAMLVLTTSSNIINLNPAEVVFIRTKISYITIGTLVSFLLSTLAFVLLNGLQIIDLITAFQEQSAKVKADME